MQEVWERTINAMQVMADSGQPMDFRKVIEEQRAFVLAELQEEARKTTERMESYMEDQLVEGKFMAAISECVDDITTFPAMVVKGPVIRRRSVVQWTDDGQGNWTPQVESKLVPEWERVDPFYVYPSKGATTPNDGDFIEFHRMRRDDLQAMKGVAGYSDDAIDAVLMEHGRGGLKDWTMNESERAHAEGRDTNHDNTQDLIDALQMWGSVQGTHLREWGMDEASVPDLTAEYEVEVWVIGRWVIKAVLNEDPLRRRPYYKTSWEPVPGLFWGNSPMDQMRDTQDMCNAAARAIANNMGIASGPQVWVNLDRLPPGEDVTEMYPWKMWQTKSDPNGATTAPPVGFFQPAMHAGELMAIYEKFAAIADDVVGVPRYMSGGAPGGGIGRTATGMSMLVQHAGKIIQQSVGLIDLDILTPLLERLYHHNMLFAEDPSIKGDVRVQARGAKSLIAKETAMVRRNEFLQQTMNPVDLQITGIEGRAEVLRETAKGLDMNVDKVVPALPSATPNMLPAPQSAGPGDGQVLDDGGTPVVDSFN
jgi:hypothetical protein